MIQARCVRNPEEKQRRMKSLERFASLFLSTLLADLKSNVLFPLIGFKIIIALYALKNIIGSFH